MKVNIFPLGPLQTNCYVVCNELTNEAIIIDAGANPVWLLHAAAPYDVKAILLTHAHYDHIAGLNQIRNQMKAPLYLHGNEQEWLKNPELNRSGLWSSRLQEVICDEAEFELEDGQLLSLAGFTIKVLHTPGHSPGGTSFLIHHHLFCGDTLFARSIGRTDLPGGDHDQLMKSIRNKILVLPDETLCHPGHGFQTNIARVKEDNLLIKDS